MARSSRAREAHDVAFHAPHVGPLLRSDAELPTGGAETQIVIIARELARRGLRVAVVVADPELPPSVDGIDLVFQPAPGDIPVPLRPLRGLLRALGVVHQANAP